MYIRKASGLGQSPGRIDTLRMRKDVCPADYETGERRKSETVGLLSQDVTRSNGRLVIADFVINRSGIRPATMGEKLLKDTLAAFESDPNLRFRIVGFTDCIGPEQDNLKLRQERANAVFRLLGTGARSRVVSVEPAPAGTSVPGTDNGTAEGRARNRSVVVEFWQENKAPQPKPPIDFSKSVKEWSEKQSEGPMEIERRKRQAAEKFWKPMPETKRKSIKDQIRQRLRDERVPDWVIDQLFKTAAAAGRPAASLALNQMNISQAARAFVKARLQDLFTWSF